VFNKIKLPLTTAIVVIFAITAAVPAIVLANEDGSDDQSGEVKKQQIEEHKKKLRDQAQNKVQSLRDKAKTQTAEVRQKNCEARQDRIDAKIKRFAARADHHKAKLDNFYSRVKQFHDDRQLDTPNYESLTAAVDTAQANAAAAIASLKDLQITPDCTDPNIADDLVAFREAVSDTRDALKAYRSALKELLVAVKQSIPSETGL
jgi:hypothetical protein